MVSIACLDFRYKVDSQVVTTLLLTKLGPSSPFSFG
jgi:hypothetical protein